MGIAKQDHGLPAALDAGETRENPAMPGLTHLPGGPAIPMFWRADPAGLWTWSCPQWTRVTGLPEAQSLGHGWLDAVHPQDRGAASRPLAAVEGHGTARSPLRLRLPGNDGYRAVMPNASPRLGPDGRVHEWVGAMLEERSCLPDHDRRAAELHHHMRNAMAVIRSVARRTARTSDTVDHYAAHFEGRLDALARVQDAVIRSPEGGVDLEGLIGEELLAHRVGDAAIRVEGPPLRLTARAAEAFGLALHELVINAVKFGAFASSTGAASVRWTEDRGGATPLLRFAWHETGIAVAAAAPRRRGFGTEMIERSLPYELNAVTHLAFAPGEFLCIITVPLTRAIARCDGF